MTLRKWDLSIFQCDTVFETINCADNNSLIEIEGERVVISGEDKIIIVDYIKNMPK